MEIQTTAIVTAVFLATVNWAIINYLSTPLKRRWPLVDMWWLIYVALVTGFIIGWFSEINLFEAYFPAGSAAVGRVLTGILVGGGSSLIYDIFGKSKP